MKKSAKIYIYSVILIGASIGCYSIYAYFTSWGSNWVAELTDFLVLLVLCSITRAFPVYIRQNQSMDVSFISIFAAVLIKGPLAAVTIAIFSTPLEISSGETKNSPKKHIFNTPPIKTCFNTSNFILSIYLPGLAYQFFGGVPGDLTLPDVLLPAFIFIVLTLFVNTTLLTYLFRVQDSVKFGRTLIKTYLMLLPNVAAVAPIGFFLALILNLPGGQYFAFLFLAPLMLARYAFKLYLDSKNQYYKMIQVLTAAIEAKDKYTEGHSRRVEMYAEQIARAMHFSENRIEVVKVAALLHDVGKIGIADTILKKPSKLTNEERIDIEKHPAIGLHILEDIDLPYNTKEIILHHHERYDGMGYPSNSGPEKTPLESYILGVADAFDAMTSDRPYRNGMKKEIAINIIREESGKQFHPDVAKAFLDLMKTAEETRESAEVVV